MYPQRIQLSTLADCTLIVGRGDSMLSFVCNHASTWQERASYVLESEGNLGAEGSGRGKHSANLK